MVVVVSSSMPSWPCTTSARSRPSWPSASATGLQPAAIEDAHELALHQGRVRHRPQQVEDGARVGASSTRGAGDVAHGAVMARRHQEADPGFDQRLLQRLDRHFEADAQGGQDVGRTGFRGEGAVAMLGHRACRRRPRRRPNRRRRCRCRGGRRRCPRCRSCPPALSDAQHLGAQGARAAGQFLGRLAADLEAHQEGAHLGRCRVARRHDVERAFRLVDAEGSRRCLPWPEGRENRRCRRSPRTPYGFASCRFGPAGGEAISHGIKNSSSRSPAWIATAV